MALSREQYEHLMLEYSQSRDRHRHELEHRRNKIYAQIPEYHRLDQLVSELSVRELDGRLFSHATEGDLGAMLAKCAQEKKALLLQAGYPEDYLNLQYDCPECRDTGYIDGHKCSCFRRREMKILYRQSRLEHLMETNSFSLLSEEFYRGQDLERFRSAAGSCQSFIRNFDSRYENLFFYGTVGTGKSFLSISTAGELLRKGYSVLYFSAAGLFETISANVFQSDHREEHSRLLEDLHGCDLLVIDDLGTEVTNNFVASQLFALINERDLGQKSTIISTNLSLPELRERYSDRIFSRITSNYTVRKLTGPDIRLEKKVRQ